MLEEPEEPDELEREEPELEEPDEREEPEEELREGVERETELEREREPEEGLDTDPDEDRDEPDEETEVRPEVEREPRDVAPTRDGAELVVPEVCERLREVVRGTIIGDEPVVPEPPLLGLLTWVLDELGMTLRSVGCTEIPRRLLRSELLAELLLLETSVRVDPVDPVDPVDLVVPVALVPLSEGRRAVRPVSAGCVEVYPPALLGSTGRWTLRMLSRAVASLLPAIAPPPLTPLRAEAMRRWVDIGSGRSAAVRSARVAVVVGCTIRLIVA